eukprot:188696-Pelagomonas_calceolata.AAC.2
MDMWNRSPSSWTGLKQSNLGPVPLTYTLHCTGPIHQGKVSPSSISCNVTSKALLLNSSNAALKKFSTFACPRAMWA